VRLTPVVCSAAADSCPDASQEEDWLEPTFVQKGQLAFLLIEESLTHIIKILLVRNTFKLEA
jgi:hypothetical protein